MYRNQIKVLSAFFISLHGHSELLAGEGITFGMLPHNLGWGVAIHRAVEHTSFAIDAILVVGLHHKSRGYCRKREGGRNRLCQSLIGLLGLWALFIQCQPLLEYSKLGTVSSKTRDAESFS